MMSTRGAHTALSAREQEELRPIRAFLQSRVDATSLRRVAEEIGMSPMGLSGFLDGRAPFEKTRRKVRGYYFASFGADTPPGSPGDAHVLLRRLVADLPLERRLGALDAVTRVLAALHEQEETLPPLPAWLSGLLGEVGPADVPGAREGR